MELLPSPIGEESGCRRILARFSTAAAVLSLDGVVVRANARLAALLDLSEADLERRSFAEFLPPAHAATLKRLLLCNPPTPRELETPLLAAGRQRFARLLIHSIHVPEPHLLLIALELTRVHAIAEIERRQEELEAAVRGRTADLAEANTRLQQELTERQRVEAALRASEARLTEAQKIANLGSWEWDLETGALMWSDQLYRQLGEEPGQKRWVRDGRKASTRRIWSGASAPTSTPLRAGADLRWNTA